MPEFEALYYPSFEPPSAWLRGSLLFFDKIRTIVPQNVDFRPSDGNLEIIDSIPNSFETVHPAKDDVSINDLNLGRMSEAFEIIKKNEPKIKDTIYKKEQIKLADITGHSFLHEDKISEQVLHLLKKSNLVKQKKSSLFSFSGKENFYLVNKSASNLIVSEIADKIAKRYGWNTVTDSQIDFTVNSLNSFQDKYLEEQQNTLISSIINCEIPREIQLLKPEKYVKIRDKYSDVREPFQRCIHDLSSLYRLETIEDKQTLQKQIAEITTEFNSEVEEFKNSRFGRTVKRWMPIGIGSLATLAGAAISEPIVSITSASVSVSIQVIQESFNFKEPESNQTKVCKLIAGMQKDILKKSVISRLVNK
jgi:hypothetical protein